MSKPICIHILEVAPRGNIGNKSNIGTVAAQRALYNILTNLGKFDISVSTYDPKDFSLYHPEYNDKIYGSLQPRMGSKVIHNNIQWVIFNYLNLSAFTFLIPLINLGIFRADITARMKECDVFVDLNLENLRGIPISTSLRLIKQKPRILVIHKLFWSLRMLASLWFIFIVKSIFKKKLIIGPASFGPFKGLPLITQWLVRFILNRFVDLILVREPHSAKLLSELGVKNYVITADAALIAKVNPTPSSHNPFPSSKPLFGVAPAMLNYTLTKKENDNYITAHAKCLDNLIDKYDATVIFLPSSSEDSLMCEMIRDKMSKKHRTTIIITSDVDEYETWIRKLDLLITTRMHPSIIAARNFIPFCSIIYDHKQLGMLQQIGLQSFSIPISRVSYHNLRVMIERAIQNRSEIKEVLKQTLPDIRDKSMITFKAALSKIIHY